MDEQSVTPPANLSVQIEALLFVASESVTLNQLTTVLDISTNQLEKTLEELEINLQGRGIHLQRHGGRVQLTTSPETAEIIERFLGLEATSRLSNASLETLSIIAYEQPVTRPHIDAIRGVNSDGVLKSLLTKGLIQEIGRAESPGRPFLYSTTSDFLQHFGLNSLDELPPLSIEENEPEDK